MSMVDLRINVDDDSPVISLGPHRRCNSLTFPPLFDSLTRNTSFNYNKLPDLPLRLSVLKLDSSFFDVQVSKSATVAELRKAVEDVFSFVPEKGLGTISWPHVWGHFCLCYHGRKLLVETEYIRSYGIQDGDQLQFIHHLSNNRSQSRRQSMRLINFLYRSNILLQSNRDDDGEQNEENDCYDDMENGKYKHYEEKGSNVAEQGEAKWDRILRRWLPCSRLSTNERKRGTLRASSSSSFSFLDSLRRIMFCTSNPNSRKL